MRRVLAISLGVFLFVFSWLFRFNDPNGSFVGMTDDHFFYVVRGWQILFGDLPVRDFVDHGAPLYYYIAAAVQLIGGRGTLSEIVFSVTALSAGAVLTYWLAARASGSWALGAAAAMVQILLLPRFYNYPKILVYAAAVPALWAFIDQPTLRRTAVVALVTAVGFLLRHDHGAFVAAAMAAAVLLVPALTWTGKLRQGAAYAALVLLILSPYLLFIESHAGLGVYTRQALAWAERDRQREPVVFPGLFDEPVDPALTTGVMPDTIEAIRQNWVAWFYYLELALPYAAAVLLALSRNACRPEWAHAAVKIAVVALLALVLNAGFLRSTLAARLADPSVPHAILLAWMTAAAWRMRYRGEQMLRPALRGHSRRIATAAVLMVAAIDGIVLLTTTSGLGDRLGAAHVDQTLARALSWSGYMRSSLATPWPLERWTDPAAPGVMRLAFYLRDCTKPTDRVLIESYLPQVLALSQRAFAGGHADLRPGFFRSEEAQRLTVERLKRQSVPVIAVEPGEHMREMPLVFAYLDEHYRSAGARPLDERVTIELLVRKDATPTGHYELLDWPCFK